MDRLLTACKCLALLGGAFGFVAWGIAAADFSYAEQERAHMESSVSTDVAAIRSAVLVRAGKVDTLLDDADAAVRSIDAAAKKHTALAATLDRTMNDELAGVKPTLQNANAVLLQTEQWNAKLREIAEQNQTSLQDTNAALLGNLAESKKLLAAIRERVEDPSVAETQAHLNSTLDAVDKALHPPKQTRGQKVLGFIINAVFGNAVQGAVRR